MFSNSSKYAIKAVLYLALHSDEDNKLAVKDICTPINVPRAYLAKLLHDLSRHQIVSSTRGPGGGFYLSAENINMPLMAIIAVIDGKSKMESCMLSLEDCSEGKPCPLHHLISSSRTKLLKSLENETIRSLAIDLKSKKTFLPL
ncbi:MAG TPA: Rrf2 family transcriptional regulator [Eudoraea sp.]|nr:Rrf2 family transcriptional regulator [Eudoraea sp.]